MIRLPTETLAERAQRMAASFEVILPEGPGPFPVVVMLHGCGRPDGPQPYYARAAQAAGIASIVVDSFAPRQIDIIQAASLVCTGMRLWGRERAGDLLAALEFARQQSWAAPDCLGAIGWSHGGWTIMDALSVTDEIGRHAGISDAGPQALAGLRFAYAVYPWCGTGSHTTEKGWQTVVPLTVVIAGRDQVARPGPILRATARLMDDGVPVDVVHYPEATHSFDEYNSINPLTVQDPVRREETVAHFVRTARQHLMGCEPVVA